MAAEPARQRIEDATRVFLRPIGSPVPLGFAAVGVASLVLAGLELSWFSQTKEWHSVGWLLLAFPFPLQLVACVFAFLGRDGAAGTAMGVLSGAWLSIGILHLTTPPGSTSPALGVLLFVVAAVMLLTAAATATGKVAPALVLVVVAVRFSLTAAQQVTHGTSWEHAAGVMGCVLCGVAVGGAFALELNDALHRSTLPVLRRGLGRRSVEGDLADQVEFVAQEPGVREQL